MMLYSVITLLMFLTVAWAQGPLPSQCALILLRGSSSPYVSGSSAASYQTFCSVREEMSQCIADNQAAMIAGNNPVDWALGMTYVKTAFDQKAQNVCSSLANVASDLECLKSNQNTLCENILPDNTQLILETLQQYKSGSLSEVNAKEAICEIMTASAECWKFQLSGCSKAAIDFMSGYYGMYSVNCLSALPPEFGDSAFVSCALGSFSDVIHDISQLTFDNFDKSTDFIFNFTFSRVGGVCAKSEEFSKCLIERAQNTTNEIDRLIMQFVNVAQIKDTFDLACNSFEDLQKATDCLPDLALQIPFCAGIYFNLSNEQVTTMTTDMPDTNTYAKQYCPKINDMVDCMTIPLSRCNQGLTSSFKSLIDGVMSDSCKALSDQGSSDIDLIATSSEFVKCGVPLSTQISGIFGDIFDTSNSNSSDIINTIMDALCRSLDWYVSCIEKRVPSSSNYIDIFIKEIIDFSGRVNHKEIVADICNNRIQDILQNVECMISKNTSNLVYCAMKEISVWNLFGNTSTADIVKMNGNTIRSTICKPIENIISCGKTHFGSCSPELEPLFDSIPKSLLRTDCAGLQQSLTTPFGDGITQRLASSGSTFKIRSKYIGLSILFTLFAYTSKFF